jgi:hypothetical protein
MARWRSTPPARVGDDIEIYTDESRREVLFTWHGLRQQTRKPVVDGRPNPNQCLADFIAPKDTGIADYIGLFAVTGGIGLEKREAIFQAKNDDYGAIMLKAIADRLAEAFAELLHERVRRDLWGYAFGEDLTSEKLIKEAYRGIRPAPGYPAAQGPDRRRMPATSIPARSPPAPTRCSPRSAGRIRRVVLLGPVHRVPVRGLALPGVEGFATPLGIVPLDRTRSPRSRDLPQVGVSAARPRLRAFAGGATALPADRARRVHAGAAGRRRRLAPTRSPRCSTACGAATRR